MKENELEKLEELVTAVRVSNAIALAVAMGENITEHDSRGKVLRQLSLVESAVSSDDGR